MSELFFMSLSIILQYIVIYLITSFEQFSHLRLALKLFVIFRRFWSNMRLSVVALSTSVRSNVLEENGKNNCLLQGIIQARNTPGDT